MTGQFGTAELRGANMERAGGGSEHQRESPRPSSLPADAPEPKDGVRRTKPAAAANATAAAVGEGTSSERFPSYIRRKSTGAGGNEEGGERETEKGYVGGDRVRLLVGR